MIEPYLMSFARVYGALLLLPLSSFGIGEAKRIALAGMLALVVGAKNFQIEFIVIEFIIGLMVALPSMLLLDFFIQGAEIFDVSRGASMDVVYSPNTQHHEHSLQQIIRVCGLSIYFSSGAVAALIRGLTRVPHVDFLTVNDFGKVIMFTLQEVGTNVICLVLPFAFASAFIEFVICWGVKALPNLSASNESYLLRLIAGAFFLQFSTSDQSIQGARDILNSVTQMGVVVLGAASGGI